MKRFFTLGLMMIILQIQPASAQLLKKMTGGSKSTDSSTVSTTKKSIKDIISGAKSGGLTTDEIAAGLKEAYLLAQNKVAKSCLPWMVTLEMLPLKY